MGKRKTSTQIAATPTLYGDDAKGLLESLEAPTERAKVNGKKLIKFFESGKGELTKAILFSEMSDKDQKETVEAMRDESIESSYDFKRRSWERD